MNKNLIVAIIGTILTSIVYVSAQEQYNCPMAGGMMYGIYGGYGTGMMLFSWVTYLLMIALVIAAIYWLITNANKKR